MSRTTVLSCCLLVLWPVLAPAADSSAAPAKLTAAQILEKNAAARGGLAGWRAVNSLSWTGKMDAGGNRPAIRIPGARSKTPAPLPKPSDQQVQLPFVLEMQRPRKSRLEIQFNGQTAVQVYDGTHGWKLRPFLNRHEVETYTTQELKEAGEQSDLDGPLFESAANGTTVTVAGTDTVEGQPAYKLALTSKDKKVRNVWIDAKTFLEVKMDGTPRRLDGRYHPVTVFLRNYKTVSGLVMPMVYETSVKGVKTTEKINIDAVIVNPKLADSRFAKLE